MSTISLRPLFSLFAILTTLMLFGLLAGCSSPTPPTPEPEPTMTLPDPTVPPVTVPSEADWPPQLVAYSPAFQEETALDGTITLRFDQPMAQESVQAAFKVSTAADTTTTNNIPGNFTWPRPDTMVFTPANNWERGQVYYVNLDSSAQSVNAIPMAEPVALTVQTVGFLEVSQLTPAEGAQDIATDSVITVAFNRPVVPLVATTDQEQLPNPLTISPEVDGRGEWVSTSIYQFVPTAGLAGGTSYNVTVNAGLTDVMGGVLATAVSHNFNTIPPQLVNSIPYPDQTV
jgi:alpha-2-macroglobulin